MLVGIVGFLSDLRKLGFKTFSPFIDETYDTIVDNEQRRTAIVNEVERITKLNETEYLTLLDNCNTIAA